MMSLEPRLLFAVGGVPQEPLPATPLQEFVVDNWDNDVTNDQFARNEFHGNSGRLIETTLSLSAESNSGAGNSLRLTKGPGSLGGYFTYLFARSSISSTTNPAVPAQSLPVIGQYLDTQDIYRGFGGLSNRSLEQVRFDIKHALASPLVLKLELKDEAGRIVSATRSIGNTGASWSTIALNLPSDFSGAANFDWRQIDHMVFVVEDSLNAPNWTFLLDNLRIADTAGSAYPDFAAMTDPNNGSLLPQYEDGFLDYVRRTSSLFFVDYASKFAGAAGMIQDTSTSADLATIGGVGFQLTSYVIDSERGYLARADSADRVVRMLRHMFNAPQGTASVGTLGYEGFFYHFLGVDGLRKQNFGVTNANELSPIDSALAIAGVVTAGQYFNGGGAIEAEIRDLSQAIYGRVNWRFMVNDAPGPEQNQFFLGWRPETGDGGYQYDHPTRPGRFTGSSTNPLTIDYYTDEGLLLALLAMGSPNPAHRPGREVWDAIFRSTDGGNFVKSFPGALFTYQFASSWVNFDALGTDNHPTRPTDFFENTRRAIAATRNYAIANTTNRDTWLAGKGATRWGLSAASGPVQYSNGGLNYFADAARPAALNINQNNPLEVGTVTPYGVGSSIIHEPAIVIDSLWRMARHDDLNQDGKPDLLNPRFGFVDAFNLDIADAAARGSFAAGSVVRPSASGPWANINGYAIDQGPMLILIDNYLSGQFVPNLFMSHPQIRTALNSLFPGLPPAVLAAEYLFEDAPNRLTFRFSENVQASVVASDLVLTNLTTSTTIDPADLSLSYSGATNTATFSAVGVNGGRLPDGNYRAELPAGSIADVGGNALADDFAFEFFVLAGDANRDRLIDIGDFAVLAANFNLPGAFSRGDFDYTGVVDIGDFAILASKFNTSLPAESPRVAASLAIDGFLTARARTESLFSVAPVSLELFGDFWSDDQLVGENAA